MTPHERTAAIYAKLHANRYEQSFLLRRLSDYQAQIKAMSEPALLMKEIRQLKGDLDVFLNKEPNRIFKAAHFKLRAARAKCREMQAELYRLTGKIY
jgi:hypothetical protein